MEVDESLKDGLLSETFLRKLDNLLEHERETLAEFEEMEKDLENLTDEQFEDLEGKPDVEAKID